MQHHLFQRELPQRQLNPSHFPALAKNRPELDSFRVESRLARNRDGEIHSIQLTDTGNATVGPMIVKPQPTGAPRRTQLFTVTSKMSALSFSLAAGPTKLKGTCPASVPRDIPAEARQKPADSGGFICGDCYAGKNNYLKYTTTQVAQTTRLKWVLQTLGDGTFVREMTEALDTVYHLSHPWALDMQDLDRDYFRIHDSGDFFDVENVSDPFAYARAWFAVCRNLPYIKFWAPTRMWVFPEWRTLLSGRSVPRNLSIRPSALWFDAPPPRITGMAAGSGSAVGAMRRVWNCPAYKSDDESCASAECRKCWDAPKTPVSYKQH